jgi:ankyrin repeat protein
VGCPRASPDIRIVFSLLSSLISHPLRLALHLNVLGTDDVVEMVEYMVDRNPALLSSCDQDRSLPLHVACGRGASCFPIVQSLVDLYKVSVKSVTSQGDLPLFLACESPKPSLETIFLLRIDAGVIVLSSIFMINPSLALLTLVDNVIVVLLTYPR